MSGPGGWRVPGYAEVRRLGPDGEPGKPGDPGNPGRSDADGRVVLAVNEMTGARVAIGYLPEDARREPGFAGRFRERARILMELDDPHLARVYGYAEGPQGAAVVMEVVNGATLRALLRRPATITPETALVVLKDSLLGLAAAHEAGVVHGDHRPERVLVQGDGTSKLAGLGLALRAGSAEYLAPELAAGRPASAASDMYAATAVFYECLTGRAPSPDARAGHVAGLLEPLRAVAGRGLAGDPALRPASAAMFVSELGEVASAACGAGWEERGRRGAASAAAALAASFPLNRPQPDRRRAGALTRVLPPVRAAIAAVRRLPPLARHRTDPPPP
ncbi:hypothetical protein Pth03_51210 [Planotetraspora thailandica]|uniref:non-specific serine/threonine protein kinase n=1 Tax=Planotetraspora thailandica TaxID=487172 RepID=A0A8J3V3J3_9ACTN|nr:serine/threonine-protein kinase [Planotetraspora thailandica]GII56732.1 hypothetical protein Pth03_51210 [Planotetraspora thailandica]